MARWAIVIPLIAGGCAASPASELAQPPTWEPEGQTKCTAIANRLRPLIVEWPSADRLDLEARIRRGSVAVRYVGCRMEVLHRCTVPGQYKYAPTTRQEERVTLFTREVADDHIIYALFIAALQDYQRLNETFNRMISSLQVSAEATHESNTR